MIVGDEDDLGAEDFELFRSPLVIDFCLSAKENLGRCILWLERWHIGDDCDDDDDDACDDVDGDDDNDCLPDILGPLSAPIWLQVCASICRGLLSVVPSFCKNKFLVFLSIFLLKMFLGVFFTVCVILKVSQWDWNFPLLRLNIWRWRSDVNSRIFSVKISDKCG